MKKIINYKKYDTETATKISEWRRGRRFDKVHECLYRKKRENTFCMEKEVQNLNIGNRLELIGGVAQNE